MFGRIHQSMIQYQTSFCSGFVQFESDEDTANALECSHRIGDIDINITAVDCCIQVNKRNSSDQDVNSVETNEGSITDIVRPLGNHDNAGIAQIVKQMHLLDLNDDCLIELCRYVNLVGLLALRQTCTRFDSPTEHIFRMNHTNINLTGVPEKGFSQPPLCRYKLNDFKAMFVEFGKHIRHLRISAILFPNHERFHIIELILTHCNALKSLELNGFDLTGSLSLSTAKCFDQLELLTLNTCKYDDNMITAFKMCRILRELNVTNDVIETGKCFAVYIPRLATARLKIRSGFLLQNMVVFLRCNPNIRVLKIHCGPSISDAILEWIADLRYLESLNIRIYYVNFYQNVMHLARLRKLRELHINCGLNMAEQLVNGLTESNTIETLHLHDCIWTESLIEAICRCERISSLQLGSIPNVCDNSLVQLAHKLPALRQLFLTKLDSVTADGALEVVTYAKKLEMLALNNCRFIIHDQFVTKLAAHCMYRPKMLNVDISKTTAHVTKDIAEQKFDNLQITLPRYSYECGAIFDDNLSVSSDDVFYGDSGEWNTAEIAESIEIGFKDIDCSTNLCTDSLLHTDFDVDAFNQITDDDLEILSVDNNFILEKFFDDL